MQTYGSKLNKILENALWRKGEFLNTDKAWLVGFGLVFDFFFFNHAEACTVHRLLGVIPFLFGDELCSF